MGKTWRIIISIVLVAVLLAAVSGGVAMLTGANISRIYSSLNSKFNIQGYVEGYTKWFTEDIYTWAKEQYSTIVSQLGLQ